MVNVGFVLIDHAHYFIYTILCPEPFEEVFLIIIDKKENGEIECILKTIASDTIDFDDLVVK